MISLRILGEGLGGEIGAAVAFELQGTLFVPLHDLSGHIRACLDSSGRVVESLSYTAFGLTSRTSDLTPWTFASKRQDSTGFIYFGRRFYDSQTATWLTQDPLGESAGPNLYAYVKNNPLTLFDVFGLAPEYSVRDFSSIHDFGNLPLEILTPNENEYNSYNSIDSSIVDRYTLGDGTAIERDEFETGLTLFPDGEMFFEKYAGEDLSSHILEQTTGVNTSKFDACRAAEDVIKMSRNEIKEVIMMHQDLPLSKANLIDSFGSMSTAVGITLGVTARNVKTFEERWDAFCQKCQHYGITFHGVVQSGHSLGVPVNDVFRYSPTVARHAETNSLGTMINFGGPTQPKNALNYTATNDIISLPSAMSALHQGRPCILVNSLNQSPLEAHSFLGPAYRAAMYDAIYNRGILNHE